MTYSTSPRANWNLPRTSPIAVLFAIVCLAGATWFVVPPGPDGELRPADVEGQWPFGVVDVDVRCRAGAAAVRVDGRDYALSDELRSAPDLETFDLATDDRVWLRRDDGTKVPLQPARNAAEEICR